MKTKTTSLKTVLLQPLAKILLLAILALACPSLFAQGAVNFSNGVLFTTPAVTAPNGHTDRLVYGINNTTLVSGTNWAAQLYYAVGGGQLESILTAIDATPKRFFPFGTATGQVATSDENLS